MKIFRSFFKLHQSGVLAFVLCSIVFVLIFSLYDLPVGAVLYSAVLSAVICLALFLTSFIAIASDAVCSRKCSRRSL